jgi:hypothetical protein
MLFRIKESAYMNRDLNYGPPRRGEAHQPRALSLNDRPGGARQGAAPRGMAGAAGAARVSARAIQVFSGPVGPGNFRYQKRRVADMSFRACGPLALRGSEICDCQ